MAQEIKSVHDSIANTQDDVQILKGIQPKHQLCYKFYKFCRLTSILFICFAALFFALTFVDTFNIFTHYKIYRLFVLTLLVISIALIFLAIITRILFLRKAPFDDWVYEIAEKRLGTSIIFYDSKYIYINYDRGGKEVDKREFVTEMSDKSIRLQQHLFLSRYQIYSH